MSRRRPTLSDRALARTTVWETPTHELGPESLAHRMRLTWLDGYSAGQRAQRKRNAKVKK